MKLATIPALTLWLPLIAAINYGSLEGEEESPVKRIKSKTTKSTSKTRTQSSTSKSSSVTSSITTPSSASQTTSTTTEKIITYAEDPLTTVTTTDELGRTTVKPLWWLPSEASTASAADVTTTSGSSSYSSHISKALAKQVSVNVTSTVSVRSNAGGNVVVNLGVAGSMAMIIMNLI